MAYLLLPSSRLAVYLAQNKQLKVLPIRAEDYVLNPHQEPVIATTSLKTLTFYKAQQLLAAEPGKAINSLAQVQFNKKLEGLAVDKAGTYFVSDKFGDIYTVNNKYEQKYMNSNLGIPTLLTHINVNDRSCLVVGDQQTRIKVYNQHRMHEIIAFWFLIRRVPLQLIQTSPDMLVMLAKKQNQINIQMHEQMDQFVELYELPVSHLCDSEFTGKMFFLSKQKDEHGECKYQTLAHSKSGALYLLKLFSEKIQIILFRIVNGAYEYQNTHDVQIDKDEWDYLYGEGITHNNKETILITYGKMSALDEKAELTVEQKELKQQGNYFKSEIGKDQYLLAYEL